MNARLLPWVLAAALLVVGGLFFPGWQDCVAASDPATGKPAAAAGPGAEEPPPAARAENFVLPHYQDGRKVWELRGLSATFLENDDIEVKRPRLVWFDGPPLSVTAERAVYHLARKDCVMEGGVTCERPGEIRLVTARADFLFATRQVVLPGDFTARYGDLELAGASATYDTKTGRLEARGRTTLLFTPKP